MGRHRLSLVGGLALALAGCETELPREVAIESRFSPLEVDLLQGAIDEANQTLGIDLLGHPVLIYTGRVVDRDGFHFDDFDDDHHVLYVLDPRSDEYRWTSDTTGFEYGGYATLGDLLVERLSDLGDSQPQFRRIALHEIGHFLGMTHSPDPGALMFGGPHAAGITTYTRSDQRAFCLIHDCLHAP